MAFGYFFASKPDETRREVIILLIARENIILMKYVY